jgi:hypothetical protein
MTREEFEEGYANRSGLTVDVLRQLGRIVRPCRCGEPTCPQWQSVSRTFAEEQDRNWPEWDGYEAQEPKP